MSRRSELSANREVDGAGPLGLQAAGSGRSEALNPRLVLGLQRLAGNAGVESMLSEDAEASSPVHGVIASGGGVPLESSTRMLMESRLGNDFSSVRIHTGAHADESARSINAQAYTVGDNIVFRNGRFAPDTPAGLHTLAHELTHVVQQRAGPVAGTLAPGGIRVSDPSDPFELAAERIAASAMAPTRQAAPVAAGTTSVQALPSNFRSPGAEEEEMEGEEMQRLVAQRDGDDDYTDED